MGVDIQTYRCRIGLVCIKNSLRSSGGRTRCKPEEANGSNIKPLLMVMLVLSMTFPNEMFDLTSDLTNTFSKHDANLNERLEALLSNMHITQHINPVAHGHSKDFMPHVSVTQNCVRSLNKTMFGSEYQNAITLRVIRTHLAISGVEPNPGPGSPSSEENEQQTNDSTDPTQQNSGEDYNSDAHADQPRLNQTTTNTDTERIIYSRTTQAIVTQYPKRHNECVHNTQEQSQQQQSYTDVRYSAMYEKYRTFQSRLNTFRNWPSNRNQMPDEMAEAGWWYTGKDDVVCCFACGESMMEWQPEDSPWIEHCKFRNCPHLREFKGDGFINFHQLTDNPAANTATNQVAFDDTTVEGPLRNHKTQTQSVVEDHINIYVSEIRLPDPALLQPGNEYNIQQTHNIPKCLNAQEVSRIQQFTNHTDTLRALHEDENDTAVLFDANIQDVLENCNIQQGKRDQDSENSDTLVENLQERNSSGRRSRFTCHFCQINIVNALFLPCRHLMYCTDCTRHCNRCPDCNRRIMERIQVYMK
ncbi:putative inhibitor of apoptosis [Dreissena polymorpha]|uniref:RING-type domain-containing protein n=1 Tax=Dreissena polymorpha TaxID=45954 RepID=A0A9D4D1H5_DREPO|nr:putative inhibitor of apoptosis [Dreissena polymorpha]KAH3736469.1 hypothetical protein DPMN_043038 [Dreissena polymorpha]